MERIPDAYERLFLDVIRGDQSLFVGREEVERIVALVRYPYRSVAHSGC